MRRNQQKGFTLLELLVAMTILAVIGVLGFTQFKKNTAQARYIKAHSCVEIVGNGLDQYFLKHGVYPDLGSFEAMVEANSPLVKQDFIPANAPSKDPWGQPYEGVSSKSTYSLTCQGDPVHPEDFKKFTMQPGQFADSPSTVAPAAGAAPAGGATK